MIRFSVFYPAGDGATFDHDYYRDVHVPLAAKTWRPAATQIDRGVNGPYVAAVHFTFESLEQMQAAMASAGSATVRADVPNYTNITPFAQTSEIVDRDYRRS